MRLKWKLDLIHLETVLILTLHRSIVYAKHHRLGSRFGRTRWNSKVMWVMVNLVSVCLETVLVSVQDRCMVCAKRTIGSVIVLDAPDFTPR
jgi:hypothetical protein